MGVLALDGHALALTCAADATKAGPSPSSGLSPPSSVRWAPRTPAALRALSALALYGWVLPDVGGADGPLVFRTSPSKRAAATTPGSPSALPGLPERCASAFAAT